MFEVGKIYNRRADIHGKYKGQQQGGICTPKGHPFVFLFTGESGEQYGYSDGWDENGVFLYTGEGQLGNMQFLRGNKAIRDHQENGKDILLFETLPKRRGVRFRGYFTCSTWEVKQGKDLEMNIRDAIVFHLLPLSDDIESEVVLPTNASLLMLKEQAYEAASSASMGTSNTSKQTYYKRSKAVKQYVLARADGVCENCDSPAPFMRANGTPYLEPHHIRKVSDGGPDHPRWVAGVCPNCHRAAHSSINAKQLNAELSKSIAALEET